MAALTHWTMDCLHASRCAIIICVCLAKILKTPVGYDLFRQVSTFHIYRVSSKTVPTWLFALLLASTQANCKSLVVFEKFRICYKIGTRILKIDLEIAEIFEVNVATFNMELFSASV